MLICGLAVELGLHNIQVNDDTVLAETALTSLTEMATAGRPERTMRAQNVPFPLPFEAACADLNIEHLYSQEADGGYSDSRL